MIGELLGKRTLHCVQDGLRAFPLNRALDGLGSLSATAAPPAAHATAAHPRYSHATHTATAAAHTSAPRPTHASATASATASWTAHATTLALFRWVLRRRFF